jgi:hypothetical protein
MTKLSQQVSPVHPPENTPHCWVTCWSFLATRWPPLWHSGQSSWLQTTDPEVPAWFAALPDFLLNSGFGTGSTQPREDNSRATWKKLYRLRFREPRLTAVGVLGADHATLSVCKSRH